MPLVMKLMGSVDLGDNVVQNLFSMPVVQYCNDSFVGFEVLSMELSYLLPLEKCWVFLL